MPASFQWIQYAAARQALAQRLADPDNVYWTDAENGRYIIEGLRVWNALTETWNFDFPFAADSAQTWYNLATLAESPRLQTLTDDDLCTLLQYHLLEPPTGVQNWTGTSQFSLVALETAMQRRRDEVIQASGCHLANSNLPSTPGVSQINLPDTTLEPRRMRFLPDGEPGITLTREGVKVWDQFAPAHGQTTDVPGKWSVLTGSPLVMDVDVAPNTAGTYDMIALVSGESFNPPNQTLLGIPDDWAWVVKWGALADLLSRESETTDLLRAQFCMQRYLDGIKAMRASNWILKAEVNGEPVDTSSLAEADHYSPEWEENPDAWPKLIAAGMDFVACCPIPADQAGMMLTVVGNAPIPVQDTDYVQVTRDTFDAILAYAQFLAMLKQGGAEFQAGTQLLGEFALAVQSTNSRLANMGLYADVLRSQGSRQEVAQPR